MFPLYAKKLAPQRQAKDILNVNPENVFWG